MRLHYRSCYPNADLIPLLNPMRLRLDYDWFISAAAGKITISLNETTTTMSLIAIFGHPSSSYWLPAMIPGAWKAQADLAGKAVLAQLLDPGPGDMQQRRQRQKSWFDAFVLALDLTPVLP